MTEGPASSSATYQPCVDCNGSGVMEEEGYPPHPCPYCGGSRKTEIISPPPVAESPRPTVTVAEVGHFLSESLDDYAPLNERLYINTARALARKFPSLGIEVES